MLFVWLIAMTSHQKTIIISGSNYQWLVGTGYPSQAIREKLMTTNFGSATLEIKNGNFEKSLASAKSPISLDPYAVELENGNTYQIVSALNDRSVIAYESSR